MNSRTGNIRALTAVGLFALLGVTAAPGVVAQVEKAGPPSARAAIPETTEVGGEIPADFVGRWAAFAAVKLPSGALRHFARMWEVTRGKEQLEVHLKRAEVPTAVRQRMDDASKNGKPFQPSEEEIKIIADSWESIVSSRADITKIENKLLAADAYPEEFNRDVITKGSPHSIVFNEVYSGKSSVLRTYSIYAVRESKPDELKGTFITTSTALAPFPIPITLKGEFSAYRAGAPAPPPSFLERMMEMFSGCGG